MARNWKKMSKEEEDKKRQETIDKAIETMNKGIYEYLDSDRFKTLLDTMSKFHDYSMNNTLLILGQNPHATHLAGYNKWQQDFNRQVKRGEKGLMIWMPVEIKVKEKQYVLDEKGNRILGDDGKFKKEEVVVKKHTFKIGYTFDVSQTEQIEGKEVVELSPVKELEGDVKDYQALTKALMEITLYKENDADPYVYSGRYDIGSENGDIIDTISHYLDWKIEHENDQNALLFKNDFIPEAEAGRKLSVDEAKRVDKIFDEMLKRELKYKTINFTREHFETVDTARDVMRVEEKMDELYNNGDISGKTHDEVLNHLSEVEEALYERIKDNMENNFLFKTQVENAVNADGKFGYKRALYNQDDVYKDVVKDVLEIDDLQKDTDEMEL